MDNRSLFLAQWSSIAQRYLTLVQETSITFWPTVQDLSEQVLHLAREILSKAIPELASSSIAIATTGSDSRLEKCGLGSPVELIVITPEKPVNSEQQTIIETINCLCSTYSSFFCPLIEHKGLAQERVSYYQEKSLIPTRAFDALLLVGNQDTFRLYKEKLWQELKKTNLNPFKKEFLQRARKELNRGALSDPSKGEIKYHKKGGRGAKHDILRVVQYSIALKIFSQVPQEQFAQIPQTVVGRISWLQQNKHITLAEQECQTLLKNYTETSIWYAQLNALAHQYPEQDVVILTVCPKNLYKIKEMTKEITKKITGN